MVVSLKRIPEEELNTLKNLLEFVAYDLSELNGANINEHGQYTTNLDIRIWFEDPNYKLFFVCVDNELAGFVVVRYLEEEKMYYLNHFFILRKFRRRNFGKEAAILTFNLYVGKWRVSEFDWNVPAQIFWSKVIKEYTNDNYIETRRKDNKGPAQEFENDCVCRLRDGAVI